MSLNSPTAYENLAPDEAAHIDAVCDRFERAWKASREGGPFPALASYLAEGHGAAREVLFGELVALDRACRERYGRTVRSAPDAEGAGAGAERTVRP
jgi:hypothetical protein